MGAPLCVRALGVLNDPAQDCARQPPVSRRLPTNRSRLAEDAIARAAAERAHIVCFPECFVPGYRGPGKSIPPADPAFLERAWSAVAEAAAKADVAVVLGTERVVDGAVLISALIVNRDGTIAGFQDKVQLDPSEEGTYAPGFGRQVFQAGPLTFGVAICHEGWRYPETVRWAARRGAHVVFHPHFHEAEPGSYRPSTLRRPGELVPREGGAVPRRREHLLLRDRELRERRLADDVGDRAARRNAARLPALRRAGAARRRHRPRRGHAACWPPAASPSGAREPLELRRAIELG